MCCGTGSRNFRNLKPVKRRGNRRYYQRQDVLIIRQIRSLLYDEGFTIGGARQKLTGDDAKTDVIAESADHQAGANRAGRSLEDIASLDFCALLIGYSASSIIAHVAARSSAAFAMRSNDML